MEGGGIQGFSLVMVSVLLGFGMRHLDYVSGSRWLVRLILSLQRFDMGKSMIQPARPVKIKRVCGQAMVAVFHAPIWGALVM